MCTLSAHIFGGRGGSFVRIMCACVDYGVQEGRYVTKQCILLLDVVEGG